MDCRGNGYCSGNEDFQLMRVTTHRYIAPSGTPKERSPLPKHNSSYLFLCGSYVSVACSDNTRQCCSSLAGPAKRASGSESNFILHTLDRIV
eukprot:9493464-Pyramimonas_sp.AAC.2